MKSVKLPLAFCRCILVSLFCSYIVMVIFWAKNGFKYGVEQCGKVLLLCMPLFFSFMLIALSIIMIHKYTILVKLRERRLYVGSDKKYFSLLSGFLGYLHSTDGILYMAYRLAEDGKYKSCLKTLKKIDFRNIYGNDKLNFYNTVLYCAILWGKKTLAEETYMKCSQFLYNAAKYKGKEHICLTIGLYCFSHSDYYWGENFLKRAATSKYKDVRCNALLTLSGYYISKEEYQKSKSCIIGASKCLRSLEQCKIIKTQMITIQKIYGVNTKKSSWDNRKETCYDN